MKRIVVLVLLLLMLITSGCNKSTEVTTKSESSQNTSGFLQVHFIDVGQADAILVQTGNNNMLIDAGNNDDSDLVVKYLKEQGVEKLDVLMGTHPHEDHIGGLDTVIKTFDVNKVYLPKVNHNTKTYKDVLVALADKKIKATPAMGGQNFTLGAAQVEIFAPNDSEYEELNNYSIVCKVTFGDNSFLLTGDAEELSEKEMLKKGYNLKADVLKVGHHGSHSSTSDQFLRAVSPGMAVISVARDNDYGHPHRETIQKLASQEIKVYRTSEAGTIEMITDGKNIDVQTAKTVTTKTETAETSKSESKEKMYVDKNGKGLIKGNINSGGDKIYHLPDQANYERTKPEAWFKTEEEALAAGFRGAKQ